MFVCLDGFFWLCFQTWSLFTHPHMQTHDILPPCVCSVCAGGEGYDSVCVSELYVWVSKEDVLWFMCPALQCVAVCRSVLQCVAACCSTLCMNESSQYQ